MRVTFIINEYPGFGLIGGYGVLTRKIGRVLPKEE
jgi:hypothetical protein